MTDLQAAKELDWELQCYGCTAESLHTRLKGNDKEDYPMIVASLLSDAQEEIERDYTEQARQTLNIAKFVLFHYIMRDYDASTND